MGWRDYGYARCFLAAQAQTEIPQTDLHGVAEGSEAEHFNFLPFQQAHFQKTLDDGVMARHGFNPGSLTACNWSRESMRSF